MKSVTPHEKYPELAKALGVKELYFKREDLHPLGSHKGRSIPVMIDHYYKKGTKRFAISSSGNAALAAALYIRNFIDAELDIFVGQHIAPHKLERLKIAIDKSPRINIYTKERPLQALTQAIQEGATSLRQSTDDLALAGYQSLAEELTAIPKVGSVFIGTSSGTTAQALADYFLNNKFQIQVHIVQTPACHAMIDAFNSCDTEAETSLADAIVDKTAFRKNALIPMVARTGGAGWCAKNGDIETALKLTAQSTGLEISANSALSVVGVMQAVYASHDLNGAAICIICGE